MSARKLIEVALPLETINAEAAREKSVPRRGHPQTIHLWWARRPLAAARSVLFAQLVDDPVDVPEWFPTEHEQSRERVRLFGILERLARWESTGDEEVLEGARREIAVSWARSSHHPLADVIKSGKADAAEVLTFLGEVVPPILDPFSGGGTIGLEAQRLGLRAIVSDLNPVSVAISKALLEIPARFRGRPPVHPTAQPMLTSVEWTQSRGLAADIHEYAAWVLHEAQDRIGALYAPVQLPEELGGKQATPIGWIWARTVASPNPAIHGLHVPLVASFWISSKKGREIWIEPIIAADRKSYRFEIRRGPDRPTLEETVNRRGATCLVTGTPIPFEYIRAEGRAGRMGARALAIVVEIGQRRVYLAPPAEPLPVPIPEPQDPPTTELPEQALGFRVQRYGMVRHRDLFSSRQLVALCAFSDLVREAREIVLSDALKTGIPLGNSYEDGGRGAAAYADAIAMYLGLGLGRLIDYNSTICTWNTVGGSIRSTFSRQAIPITWDYYETNPLAETTGSWGSCLSWVEDAVRSLRPRGEASVMLADAAKLDPKTAVVVSTDPPYYDNIGYADLSDFFYIWLRRSLRHIFPSLFSTVLVPKSAELVATPFRFGGSRADAKEFFEDGLFKVFRQLHASQSPTSPMTIYYAFKQSEADGLETEDTDTTPNASTGWETFLEALISADFAIDGTWPVRSERANRMRDLQSNALASSIVLVCRKRSPDAANTTRGEFRRLLRRELPDALRKLQQGNIAPVDVAQASIGPGMAIFSRHKEVLEANGSAMTVRGALQLINEVLDEYLASGEGDFDADTRFAITWYEQYGWEPGPFGEAETLAKARNVSVGGVVEAGICKSAAGKVRILKRPEMRPLDYDPAKDERPTIWEFTQHMIRYLEEDGETAAASLLKQLGSAADATRELAYRLYNTCERKKWAEDARSYNGLILAWPELEKLATKLGSQTVEPSTNANGKPSMKQAAKKQPKRQQSLFKGDDE